jgi:hypothetical protein
MSFSVCVINQSINQSIFLTFISCFYYGHKFLLSPIQGHYKSMINRDGKPVKLETLGVCN